MSVGVEVVESTVGVLAGLVEVVIGASVAESVGVEVGVSVEPAGAEVVESADVVPGALVVV